MRDRLRNLLKSAWRNLSLTKRFHFETSGNVTFNCIFFPGLDGLPLPTTPSTKKARAGQLNKKDQIAESLKVPVLRDGPTSTYAHCS